MPHFVDKPLLLTAKDEGGQVQVIPKPCGRHVWNAQGRPFIPSLSSQQDRRGGCVHFSTSRLTKPPRQARSNVSFSQDLIPLEI